MTGHALIVQAHARSRSFGLVILRYLSLY